MPLHDPQPEPEDLGTFVQFESQDSRDECEIAAATPPPGSTFGFEPKTPPQNTPLTNDTKKRSVFDRDATFDESPRTRDVPAGEKSTASMEKLDSGSVDDIAVPDTILPGMTLFGQYRTIRLLGKGGMGEVWLVLDTQLNRKSALKLMRQQYASIGPKARSRFRREAQLMADIKHPCSVHVNTAKIGENVAFIDMDFLEGESIDRLLEPGRPVPLAWIRGVLEPMSRVLDYVHSRPSKIIHRDLKPSNLMLLSNTSDETSNFKLLDMGIAKSLTTAEDQGNAPTFLTGQGEMPFTPQYASPEQIMAGDDDTEELDHRSDLYSLGVILYQFLAGRLPFEGRAVQIKHLKDEPPPFASLSPPIDVPPGIERLVMKCLEKDRNNRPNSASAVYKEFIRYIQPDPPSGNLPRTQPDYPRIWANRGWGGSSAEIEAVHSDDIPSEPKTGPKTGTKRPWKLVQSVLLVACLGGICFGVYKVATLKRENPARNGGNENPPPPPPVTPPTGVEKFLAAIGANKNSVEIDAAEGRTEGYPNRIMLRVGEKLVGFRLIPGGKFTMGHAPLPKLENSPIAEALPEHQVTISNFYMQEFEVTNYEVMTFLGSPEFEKFASENGRSKAELIRYWAPESPKFSGEKTAMPDSLGYPVSGVRHELATAYAKWLNVKLPTEAQWEYAARSKGLSGVLYPWDENPDLRGPDDADETIKSKACIDNSSGLPAAREGASREIGDRSVQGIFDLMGNMREWCRDPYRSPNDPFFTSEHQSGKPPAQGNSADNLYVVRGGSFLSLDAPASTISAFSPRSDPKASDETFQAHRTRADIGFRLVIELPSSQ